jgi:hypothetical protein
MKIDKFKRKIGWIVTPAVFLLSVAFATAQVSVDGAQSPVERGLHLGTSTETSFVDIRMGSEVYRIPRNYLVGVRQPSSTSEQSSFSIQVLLPDFSPRTKDNASRFDELGWHDQFRALIEYPRQPKAAPEILDYYLRDSRKERADFTLIGDGYKFYESDSTVPHEFYVKDTPNGLLFFTCSSQKYGVPSPSCTVNESIGPGLGVIYHFSRQYREQAMQIDLKLRSVLETFRKSSQFINGE